MSLYPFARCAGSYSLLPITTSKLLEPAQRANNRDRRVTVPLIPNITVRGIVPSLYNYCGSR